MKLDTYVDRLTTIVRRRNGSGTGKICRDCGIGTNIQRVGTNMP
ncbi:hypothetical protein AS9A_0154 [Hoyosella subflava DQS3-9A1]|uniref:Uncharacterized protein n=1 Tax=Hoyosella subflava (strain DSM 45089 / JCM 17490 / NBRC 109087 / DQS3-9A1) TaxID=443218 RepID=F6EEG2_HOYSD|nr:hypothetical protein AS9A_0154 [Hoyosella subflava DQS3-9A1]